MPASTLSNLTQVTVTFSESVTGVLPSDLFVNGIPAYAVSYTNGGYTFSIERPAYGLVRIGWDPSHSIEDLAAPPNRFDENAPGSTWQYELVDLTPPSMASITPVDGVTVRQLNQIEVQFDELVSGVQAGDLSINGFPAAKVVTLGAGRYRFEFPQPQPGQVQVAWISDHGIKDFAAVPNQFAGGSWTYALDPDFGLPQIRINEFLAGNEAATGLKDEEGELQDWIEIHNYGSQPVNLQGLSLTDDPRDPGRWTFPAVTLGPGNYLLVYASGKDRRPTDGSRLHANFKLNVYGDYLGLFNAESPRIAISEFSPAYPEQRNDYSYGLDAGFVWKYFVSATPGAPNGTSPIARVVPKPHVNVARGFFETPFTLIVTPPIPGATIRYTTDGSQPSPANGTVYSAPLQIDRTTVFRAVAYYPDMLPSQIESQTYIFLSQVLTQPNNPAGYPIGSAVWSGYPSDYEMDPQVVNDPRYSGRMKAALRALPVLSITMEIDALFGPQNGIYTHPEPSASQRYLWERPCSAELILTNGQTGFQIDCGIRIQGNASRTPQKSPKHPFRLFFRGEYGSGRLNYPVFEDSPVTSFDTLVLRADFNNSWIHWDGGQRTRGTRLRDAWAKHTARDMGMLGGHTRHFHLYLNGMYWGVYDFGERVDAAFAASYLGGEPEEYDALAAKPTEAIDGDMVAYNSMLSTANLALDNVANYNLLGEKLDIVQFIDYTLLNFYAANLDWGRDSNWNAVRRRSPDGKFKYINWDCEQFMVDVNNNRVSNTDVPSSLHTKLIASPEYRLAFADRAHQHLFHGGALAAENGRQRWLDWTQQLDVAIIAESARWGDYRRDVHSYSSGPYNLYTRDDYWIPEVNRLATSYFVQRSNVFLGQLKTAGLYPNNYPPSFSQHGGRVPLEYALSIHHNLASGTVYYTTNGLDPRVYGAGTVEPTARAYTGPITLNSSVVVKARHLDGASWSALNEAAFLVAERGVPLRLTEIMYHPPGGDAYEFIELKNVGGTPVDLSYYGFSGVDYTFPVGRILGPGTVFLLASSVSTNSFAARYPGVVVDDFFNGNLSNGGERLAILDKSKVPEGNIVSVDYDDSGGWPVAADGAGYSIEIIDPLGDPNDPANWRASAAYFGSPGVVSPPTPASQVRLNELMADNLTAVTNGGAFPDWIELHNSGSQAIGLSNWSLTDDGNPRKFVLPPEAVIDAGGYLVIWCDTNQAAPGLHSGFALSRQGESVFLYDATTSRVDAVTFGVQIGDFTVGLIGDQWRLTVPTPGEVNRDAALAAEDNLAINEWMADASPGSSDWIELYNQSTTLPIALQGLYLAGGNTVYRYPALSFLPPGGFIQLLADEATGAAHLDFKLPAAGGTLVLYGITGMEIDRVDYGPQAEGVSQGRLPDGGSSIVRFVATASPGTNNYQAVYSGPVLNEILAVNRFAVADGLGRTPDWIELHNPAGVDFDLSGMSLSDNAGKPDKWIFPAGVSIPANGYLTIWCDGERPASTVMEALLNAGFSLGGNSGGVWLCNASRQVVDSVEYGFQVRDLSIGLSQGQWRLLEAPTPGEPNAAVASLGSAMGLRINEWQANSPAEDDWIELFNPSANPVLLSGLALADTAALTPLEQNTIGPLSFIGAQDFVVLMADGNLSAGWNHLPFRLDDSGEVIRLYAAGGQVVDSVYFGPQDAEVSEGRLPDGAGAYTRFYSTRTPGRSNYRPLAEAVINEVLTHTDEPLEDAIELYNPTAYDIAIGGWYLSDDPLNFKKFRIPDGVILPAGGFRVFYEYQFNGGVGSVDPFSLDSVRGDELWLSAADQSGNLTGYRTVATVGAAANGVSFGRYTTSIGTEYAPLKQLSFGQDNPASVVDFRAGNGLPNAAPRVGPVMINEIMFEPPELQPGENVARFEYLELYNHSTNSVVLFDPGYSTNTWRLRGAVDFDFPPGVTLAPRSYLLLVSFDPVASPALATAFRIRYGLSDQTLLAGPWQGRLDNAGERVELLRPDVPQPAGPDQGYVPYLLVEAVEYDNAPPWPEGADGGGSSLQRIWPAMYGNDPINWKAQGPTPARANVTGFIAADTDSDGLPDGWENLYAFNVQNPSDADEDADNDGLSNYDEFLLGTHPRDPASSFGAPALLLAPTNLFLTLGQTAQFAVLTTAADISSYRWLVNDVPIAGAYSPVLTLDHPAPGDNEYKVLVFNIAGSIISAPVHLTFVTPPVSMTITSGWTTNLTVIVEGPGSPTYQWKLNGLEIEDATNSTIEIADAQADDAGDYTVVITDGSSRYISPPATLAVAIRPVITQQPASLTAALGDRVSIGLAAEGSAPVSFRWRRSSVTMTNDISDSNASTYVIEALQPEDATYWDVVVTNQAGYATPRPLSDRFYVNVVTNLPTSWAVHPGTNLLLNVGAKGLQAISYQWKFNGTAIPGQTGKTLAINDVQTEDLGGYTVEVSTTNTTYTTPPAWVSFLFTPVLGQPVISTDGGLALELDGNAGMRYAVEVSTNLLNWETVATFVQTNHQTKVVVPPEVQLPYRFFRVRLQD